VGGRHHLYSDGARVSLPGRGDGLGEPLLLAWRLPNLLDTSFCIEALEEALCQGRPEIFNTDQGSQFTDAGFTGMLRGHGVAISMDGRGRYADNIFVERLWRSVKYEEVYLKAYDNVAQTRHGIAAYFEFYNRDS